MNNYLQLDPWCIIEDEFHPQYQLESESIFSIGNGQIGQRANFEEAYSGKSMLGSYVAGVYFPEKAVKANWKTGYSETNDKIANAPNWSAIHVTLNDVPLDLSTWDIKNFRRVLNLREGFLERSFEATSVKGYRIQVTVKRFLSMAEKEIGAISYTIKSLNFEGRISYLPYLDGDVRNVITYTDEPFWNILQTKTQQEVAHLWAQTRKIDFHICEAMTYSFYKNNEQLNVIPAKIEKEKAAGFSVGVDVRIGDTVSLNKYIAVISSLNYGRENFTDTACNLALSAKKKGWNRLFEEHSAVWADKWAESDVMIDGDVAAQQAIRFNIFQLFQTYDGNDSRLNISPKGFTGERFAGTTRWDSEVACIPFYLGATSKKIVRNLLLYRYNHLPKAIKNAEKLGFSNGAAFYPSSTINGNEIQNEWEFSFEEVYRDGIIAYAIYNYVHYNGDEVFLADYGLEVLIAICRFWQQRVSISEEKAKYVILGVTGPNYYENNVNNNWFSNYIASWSLRYTLECIETVSKTAPEKYRHLKEKIQFDENETGLWKDIIDNMYFPIDNKRGIFLQQDGYLDKKMIRVDEIPESEMPVIQHWTWDRIVRSSIINQADVVLGLLLFEDHFDTESIRRNFDFYEALTIHESSISSSIHSVVASKLGNMEKAYQMFVRTTRIDLDDYNNDVSEGLHITSMAGSWLAIVDGFGGKRVIDNKLYFNPRLPKKWNSYSFNIHFRGNQFNIRVERERMIIQNINANQGEMVVNGITVSVAGNEEKVIAL